MTIAQHLENKGAYQKQVDIALQMLNDGVEPCFVEKYTGISKKQLKDLQK